MTPHHRITREHLFRAIQVVSVATLAYITVAAIIDGDTFGIVSYASSLLVVAAAAFVWGQQTVLRALRLPLVTVPCIGGPLDGHQLPKPPPTSADEVRLELQQFPEGFYRLADDRLVWEETE